MNKMKKITLIFSLGLLISRLNVGSGSRTKDRDLKSDRPSSEVGRWEHHL